ncbi:helicase HerA-like domain-containing protein [Streptomyces litmocidini]|uniref:helicase HerA-like domain-containing protein n=1 Tax=Streptomyces litmocidini TaxID=67318 RepID=UPI0035713223
MRHALRAFTPDDAKAVRATVRTFPKPPYELPEVAVRPGGGAHRARYGRGGDHRTEREGLPVRRSPRSSGRWWAAGSPRPRPGRSASGRAGRSAARSSARPAGQEALPGGAG